jgi:hypothetical protein
MLCNVFEPLNIVIELLIMFWVMALFKLCNLNVIYLQKYGWLVFVSMPSVCQARSRLLELIRRFIGFEPFWIKKLSDFDFGRFLPVICAGFDPSDGLVNPAPSCLHCLSVAICHAAMVNDGGSVYAGCRGASGGLFAESGLLAALATRVLWTSTVKSQ